MERLILLKLQLIEGLKKGNRITYFDIISSKKIIVPIGTTKQQLLDRVNEVRGLEHVRQG